MPYSRLYYHFVWATKNRAEIIRESNREPLYAAIRAKVRELGGMTHALNGLTEHVHLVATVPPAISLAEFIGQVKGSSSHLAGHLHAELFAWQLGYGVPATMWRKGQVDSGRPAEGTIYLTLLSRSRNDEIKVDEKRQQHIH